MSDKYSDKHTSTDMQILRGKNYDDCERKLINMYGEDGFRICRQQLIPAGFFRREQVEVRYTMRPRPVRRLAAVESNDNFEQEKAKLLQASKIPVQQLVKIEKEMAEISSRISELSLQKQSRHPVISEIEKILEANEFTASYVRNLSERLENEFTLSELEDRKGVHERVLRWLADDIRISGNEENPRKAKVIMLVGPTGVGKTTTIAKLAARYRLRFKSAGEGAYIRLVTIDRFRIAAKEQIDRYADAMGIQSSAADSAENIREILDMDKDRLDVLLVDTIGYSPTDYENIAKMRQILTIKDCAPDMYLVVSAVTKASDLRTIMKNYEVFNYSSVIVTKYDETEYIGNVLSILKERAVPVSYVTCGQRVPRDIRKADPLVFLEKLTGFDVASDTLKMVLSADENTFEGMK